MARAIEQLGNLTVGYAALGLHGEGQGSVRQQVHDGDTVAVRATGKGPDEEVGNFGVRFLGVDAPEMGFALPDREGFVGLADEAWREYLTDPFFEPFEEPLDEGLTEHLRKGTGPGAAENHRRHAEAAEDALEGEVLKDMEALGATEEGFRFFLAFAYEVMDRYGRFLCYVNRLQPDPDEPEPRPGSYNERLLRMGMVSPYFIWPNVDPFRRADSVKDAVVAPGKAGELGDRGALGEARRWVRAAREEGVGMFDREDALALQPFEVRFLGRRSPPDRWVIDLGKGDDILIPPQAYYTVENVEDRLFVPEEYAPLFAERGWRRGG